MRYDGRLYRIEHDKLLNGLLATSAVALYTYPVCFLLLYIVVHNTLCFYSSSTHIALFYICLKHQVRPILQRLLTEIYSAFLLA